MAQVLPARFMAFDSEGYPLSCGKLYTYAAGTLTNKATYSDPGLITSNSNPVVLDDRGEAAIYGSGFYKLVLKDSADTTIWTQDDVEARDTTTSSYTSAMAGHETFTPQTGDTCFLDPNGAQRNFNPTGSFSIGYKMFVVNTGGSFNIVFDSAGSAQVITPGNLGTFVYDGTTWW